MALFKISKGLKKDLPSVKTEGYCWYTIDDSLFYIDYKDVDGNLQRQALNAKDAETLTGASLAKILSSSDIQIPTSKAVLDALAGKADEDHSHSNYVPTTRTINGHALSENITLSAEDVQALPADTVIPSITGLATIQYVDNLVSTRVEKVTGKGLSTNDYTTTEKNKLAGIATGAEVNQNAFSKVTVGSTTVEADSTTDTLTLVAGSNVTITPTNNKITIAATNTTYSAATSSTLGLVKSGRDVTIDANGVITVNDDSHAHIISNVDGLQDALDGKAALSHGTHVPTPETANNAKFLRNDNTWQTVTPANIGAAAASHGTHVTYATTAPVMDGTATVGSANTVARGDHKHPTDTSRASKAEFDAHVNNSTWTQIYDSGAITSKVNAFVGINVADYKKLKVAIKCVNITDTNSTAGGEISFVGISEVNYYFSNLFPNLISRSTNISTAMVEFTMVDGFIFCDNVLRSTTAVNMFSNAEGQGTWNMTNLGGGIMTCNDPLITMNVTALNSSDMHYFGPGSRVIVWGCKA